MLRALRTIAAHPTSAQAHFLVYRQFLFLQVCILHASPCEIFNVQTYHIFTTYSILTPVLPHAALPRPIRLSFTCQTPTRVGSRAAAIMSLSPDGPLSKTRSRRTFELSSEPPSLPPTPPLGPQQQAQSPDPNNLSDLTAFTSSSRTRSILNLTSSTLSGIYRSTTSAFDREDATPWGTGAQTPMIGRSSSFDFSSSNMSDYIFRKGPDGSVSAIRRGARHIPSYRPHKNFKSHVFPFLSRIVALFAVGVLYSLLIGHLHDKQQIAPVRIEFDRSHWSYMVSWGVAGVLLGEALPRADGFWSSPDKAGDDEPEDNDKDDRSAESMRGLTRWNEVVRSIGAFIGIAFAIRKLPWTSTLQLSLTLALANPAIWYLIDRSPSGFVLSTMVAIGGTTGVLSLNPDILPSPSPADILRAQIWEPNAINGTLKGIHREHLILGIFSPESVGVATWIASVIFVSSICFGNIGRRLTPKRW